MTVSATRIWIAVVAGLASALIGLWLLSMSLEGYSLLPDISGPSETQGGWRLIVGAVLILGAPFLMAGLAGPSGSWRRGVLGLLAGAAAMAAGVLVDTDSAVGLAALVFAAIAVVSVFASRSAWVAGGGVLLATIVVFALVDGGVEHWVGLVAVVGAVTAGLLTPRRAQGA